MAFSQSLGIMALLIMSNRRGKYGIMASPQNSEIWPETSGTTDLLLSIAAKPSPNYFSTNGEGFV
jgi:hypothetical protein